MSWYGTYGQANASDGKEGRLVTEHRFAESWRSWEMHPVGEEVVLVTQGSFVLIQELADGTEKRIPLKAGEYAINPAGIWHTADAEEPVTAVFITAGMGTEHRGRI
jgi:mannose-6-phosphate isomerase-like protein (cupin superfamily)